jgi:hypothetical protein
MEQQKAVRHEVDVAVATTTPDRPHRLDGVGHGRRVGSR